MIVALPIAALVWSSRAQGASGFWKWITAPEAVSALELTLAVAALVALTNAVFGTIIAWTLVRDDFRGKSVVKEFPARPGIFKIDDKYIGGWRNADKVWFDPANGRMTKIEQAVGGPTTG